MQKFFVIISVFTAISLTSSATASGDDCYVPMSQWQSRSSAVLWAESQGWVVHRIKIDDGCYELYGLEENGREFEVKIDPSTFEILEFEYESHGYQDRIRATDPTVEVLEFEND